MTNHVHLIVRPAHEDSLARALGSTQGRYAQYLHLQRHRLGHLWQSRFYSCVVEPERLQLPMAYVERNPVRARMTPRAVDYSWSSAAAHAAENPDPHLALDGWDADGWHKRLEEPEGAFAVMLRRDTWRGTQCGSAGFLADLQQHLGRPVIPNPQGKPRKRATATGRGGAI